MKRMPPNLRQQYIIQSVLRNYVITSRSPMRRRPSLTLQARKRRGLVKLFSACGDLSSRWNDLSRTGEMG